jgi:tyrosine-protein kinase Etk/Wzc
MARIRDILRQANGLQQRPAISNTVALPANPANTFKPSAEPEEETPFIEVGGPNGLIEASASVRAVVVPSRVSDRAEVPQAPDKRSDPPPSKPNDGTHLAFKAIPAEPATLPPPAQRFAPELRVLHHPDHAESRQYRQVLSSLKTQLPAAAPHALLFAGSSDQLRTGPLVLNLAIACAQEGPGPLVVVDAALRHPEIGKLLGLPVEDSSLRSVLAGNVSLKRAVRESGLERLHVLLAGESAEDPVGLLAGQAMLATIRHLRDRYRWVFISGPVWDGRPDVVALGSVCEAVYLVTRDENDDLKHVIPQQGGNLRGYLVIS